MFRVYTWNVMGTWLHITYILNASGQVRQKPRALSCDLPSNHSICIDTLIN